MLAPNWIGAGAHVSTIGPKTLSAHETPPEIIESAAVFVSDARVKAGAYDESFFTPRELTHLGAVLCAEAPRSAKPTPRSPCIAQRGSPAPRSCLPEPFFDPTELPSAPR